MAWLILILSLLIFSQLCLTNIISRIVGGFTSTQNQFPYQISVLFNDRHICGGSVINDQFILTAAHCVTFEDGQKKPITKLMVLAGTNRLSYNEGTLRGVKKIIVHPNYKRVLDDVALMKLIIPLKFSESVQPIELFTEEIPPNSTIIVSGWGSIYSKGPMPNTLKYNILKTIPANRCFQLLGRKYEGLTCVAHIENNGVCTGDSGGPAVYNGKLIGIANYIIQYCGSSKPDAFANVSYYVNWIKENIK